MLIGFPCAHERCLCNALLVSFATMCACGDNAHKAFWDLRTTSPVQLEIMKQRYHKHLVNRRRHKGALCETHACATCYVNFSQDIVYTQFSGADPTVPSNTVATTRSHHCNLTPKFLPRCCVVINPSGKWMCSVLLVHCTSADQRMSPFANACMKSVVV